MSAEMPETVTEQKEPELSTNDKRRAKYKAYYEAHRDHINAYRKESGLAKKSYNRYYSSNKEIIRQKNLARYYQKKEETLRQAIPLVESQPDVSPA